MSTRYGSNSEVINAYVRAYSDDGRNSNESIFFNNDVLYSYGYHFPMAVRTKGRMYLCNGDTYSTTTSQHQAKLFREVSNSRRCEVPFSALQQAVDHIDSTGADWARRFSRNSYDTNKFRDIEILDIIQDRYIDTGRVSEDGEKIYEHVLGASLLRYRGKVLLSGLDETGKGNGAYFLTLLKEDDVCTVDEALRALKPISVISAESQGLEVKRQGEWFFIPTEENFLKESIIKEYSITGEAVGRTAHHQVSEGVTVNGVQFVRGIVKHTGGDHKQVKLFETGSKLKDRKWYLAVENTQVISWSAGGNID